MLKKLKPKILLFILPIAITGCATTDFTDLLGLSSTPESSPFEPADYRQYGKPITCSEIGSAISKAYQLKTKGKNKEDIYWEITPEDSSYVQQDIYTILIETGMSADQKTHKLFTQACQQNLETYQSIFDGTSKDLYTRVDLLYSTAYGIELKAYRASLSTSFRAARYYYGRSKMDIKRDFVNAESRGGLDNVSDEINKLVYEELIEILYKPEFIDASRHPNKIMPSLDSVRTQMAPELILRVVR
ncbi:MAG: hypothetical protein ACTJHW_04280 [Paenalcaligenes sp.]